MLPARRPLGRSETRWKRFYSITLNGEQKELPGPLSVAELVRHLGLQAEHVAVERQQRSRHPVAASRDARPDGDVLEVVTLVGGGAAAAQPSRTAQDRHALVPQPALHRHRQVRSLELMRDCLDASGAEVTTVAVRRERLFDKEGRNLLDYLDPRSYTILPNTAGCFSAEDALRTARLGRELLEGPGQSRGKLGQARSPGRSRTLLPDPLATLEATRILVKEGFQVLCYTSDDPVMARRLKEAGAASVMPAGSPIGSGQGVLNPNNIRIILEDLKGRSVLSGDRRCGSGHRQRRGDRHGARLRRRAA